MCCVWADTQRAGMGMGVAALAQVQEAVEAETEVPAVLLAEEGVLEQEKSAAAAEAEEIQESVLATAGR
jgi:hypothetical protein